MPISFEERHWLASPWDIVVIASGVPAGLWAKAGMLINARPNSAAARYLLNIKSLLFDCRIESSNYEDVLVSAAYGTMVPAIVKWSSVMKSTPQRLHLNTLTSGSSITPGIVRATTIGREQFGQSGD